MIQQLSTTTTPQQPQISIIKVNKLITFIRRKRKKTLLKGDKSTIATFSLLIQRKKLGLRNGEGGRAGEGGKPFIYMPCNTNIIGFTRFHFVNPIIRYKVSPSYNPHYLQEYTYTRNAS